MNTIKTIKLSKVIVPYNFRNTKPSEKKMEKVRTYVKEHGELDKPIVLDANTLTDGYVRYLVAMELGYEDIPYMTVQEYRDYKKEEGSVRTYIAGKFEGNDKEYIWKVTKNISIEVGDKVFVESKRKSSSGDTAVATVVRVFTSDKDNMLRHKPVIKKAKCG
jgi:hypothetical protein